MSKAIPVEERFEHPQGQFVNYDAYSTADRFTVPKQKHVDIRNFSPTERRSGLTMLHLNTMTMSDLAMATMADLAGEVIIAVAEAWDHGDVDYQLDQSNWRGLTFSLTTGTNTTTSVIVE